MSDASTPTSDPDPADVAVPAEDEPADTAAVTRIDLDPIVAVAPVDPPYRARPVGAAHPRRRLGRGLLLAAVMLMVAGAVTLASSGGVSPAAASPTMGPMRRGDR